MQILRDVLVWIWRTLVAGIVGCIVLVAILRIVPPAITPLMPYRLVQAPFYGNKFRVLHSWTSYDNISPHIFKALLTSEDKKFYKHHGIDWQAVERAKKVNPGRVKRGKLPLGASTITMQTAKNVFLLPFRSYVRKAMEAGFTYLIEYLWGKERILEVYVNMIEWGDGIYGIQAASQYYFHKDAKDLTQEEAARLAAVVPNPRRFKANEPSKYIKKRTGTIRGGMGGRRLGQ